MTTGTCDADVLVIGSGIGGLATAALLARLAGRRVVVLERHFRAGGFTHTFARPGGYRWDVGVHYVGEVEAPGMPRDVLTVVTGGDVRWARMPETFERLVFPGFEFSIRAGEARFRDDLARAFPAEAAGIDGYLRDVKRAASFLGARVLRGAAPAPVAALADAYYAVSGRRRLALSTTADVLGRHVRDPRLAAVLGARWPDYGLPPSRSAFHLHSVVTHHYLDGAYYPEGSAAVIAQAAARVIEAAGGAIRVRAEVASVLVERGRAVGVRLASGEELRAPVVVSDAGARNTFLRLVPEDVALPFRDELRRTGSSMAVVNLYLGLSRSPESLGVRGENYWIHDELDHDRMSARRNALFEGEVPQLYLSFPSVKDPRARAHTAEIVASIDGEAFGAFAGTRWMRRGADYAALKERMTRALLARVEQTLPGFGALVSHRELSTPLSSEHFTAHPSGEIYGLPGTPEHYARRWLSARTPLPGLYLTGADALVPGVMGSAMAGFTAAVSIAGPSLAGRVGRVAREVRGGAERAAHASAARNAT
jgi:phytoene dehydrogenase-like protein